jgi:hypothetical protein
MTLEQLEYKYNFHDCDVFTPFEINGDSITVTFDLAKHLQYDDLKFRHGDLLQSKDSYLIVRVKFSDCLNLRVSEWEYRTSKTTKKEEKHNEKTISIEQFDSNMDFISLTTLGENKICFAFEKYGKPEKFSEIQFVCQNIDIIEEKIFTASEHDELWEKFE